MRFDGLEGEVVVVTGAARGQGAAEAGLLADAGAIVVATDVASQRPESLADPRIRYVTLDVSDEAAWRALRVDLVDELQGARLKGLVNNAGITHRARLDAVEREDWDRVIAVNLTGPMLGMRELAGLMEAGSSIVNVGSSAALTAHYPVAYTASKWGLRGLSHVAAMEYGPRGIRVNIVHPGFIETPMTANAPEAMRAVQLDLTPLERLGEADEVAQTVAFLLSDAASYISGAEIAVDGGFTAVSGAKLMADRIAAASAKPVH